MCIYIYIHICMHLWVGNDGTLTLRALFLLRKVALGSESQENNDFGHLVGSFSWKHRVHIVATPLALHGWPCLPMLTPLLLPSTSLSTTPETTKKGTSPRKRNQPKTVPKLGPKNDLFGNRFLNLIKEGVCLILIRRGALSHYPKLELTMCVF